jgi:hypothetical protein
MKTLRVVVPHLTAVTMDTVFAQAAALGEGPAAGGAEALRLSLEEVQFIDPAGLVGLWCVLRYLQRRHPAVVVILSFLKTPTKRSCAHSHTGRYAATRS